MSFSHYIANFLYIMTVPVRYDVSFLLCSGVLYRYSIPAYRSPYLIVTIWKLGKNNLDRLGCGYDYDFPC
jgi:hypothetical protein